MKINFRLAGALAALMMGAAAFAAQTNPPAVSAMLNRIGGAGTSDRIVTVLDETLSPGSDTETFVITSQGGKPCVKGSTLSAITTGIGWYLNHYANVNLAWNRLTDDLSAVTFPAPAAEETHSTTAKYRHYLNYCTFSYSMSTWTWERWQQEIDWMALHGINAPLHIIGLETVWRDLLMKDYGYSKDEANAFVGGPCFMAWFGMNNLQGHGGPNPDWWYTRQQELGNKMTERMHELGIEPVLPGFAGMVPDNFTSKTGIASNDQGGWCGFKRPNILTPASDGFNAVAEKYYARLAEVMGTSQYYSMDPFHEGGGATGGVDAKLAYSSIYQSLDNSCPGAKWFIQQWQWAGGQWQSVAEGVVPKGKLVVLDLYSDGKGGSQLNSYNGHETVYCMIPNFGARTGFFGRVESLVNSYFDKGRTTASVKGIAAVPEGIEQVPMLYDLLYEMAWMDSKPDAAKWVADYTVSRYGVDDPSAKEAWELLRTSALNCQTGLQGPHEAITCARPGLSVNTVSTWGGADIFYDTQSTFSAAYLLLNAGLSGENYSYDLVDICRQALTDYSKALLAGIKEANDAGNTELFAQRRDAFLQLLLDIDELLNTNKDFMVGHWTERARAIADEAAGTSTADREWLELNNARTLITTWANVNGSLHDYSYRQWGGIMKDLYYQRWKQWFDNGMSGVNFFNMERAWATDNSKRYPTTPTGNTADVAARLLPAHISPLTSTVAGQSSVMVQHLLDNNFKGKFLDSATRGADYSPALRTSASAPIAEIFIDLNTNTMADAGETAAAATFAIPADAPIGERTVRLTLADGTTVTYSVSIVEEITEPRTVSVATSDPAKGSVSIDGTSALSVTGTDFYVVRAAAASSYDFDHWEDAEGNNLGNANPMTYYGKESISLTAHFADNKWGIPPTTDRDINDMRSYKQYVNSFSVTQNGEDTEIYSTADMPEKQFVVAPTRIKAAPGGEFTVNWKGNDGLKYTFVTAYADFDNDGTFETELGTVGTKGAQNTAVCNNSLNVLVPFSAAKGTTHVRLRFDGAWSDQFDSTGKVPATALANRFVYDLLLDLSDSPEYPMTVTADVNNPALGTFRTENMANVYVPGEEVIITAFPAENARVARFTDNHGRELPAEWLNDNSVRFKAYDNANITIEFEPLPINGWSFDWDFSRGAKINGVTATGDPDLDLSGVELASIDPETFKDCDALRSITLPATQLSQPGAQMFAQNVKGDGTQNKIINVAPTITGTTPWEFTIEGSTGSNSYNQWGSAIFGNGTDALANNYSNGWSQFYLSKSGTLQIKWDSGSEVSFDGVTLLGKIKITAVFDGNKTLTVTATDSEGNSQTKTISNTSVMKDISRFAVCLPSGMDLTYTFAAPSTELSVAELFASCHSLENINIVAGHPSLVSTGGVVYDKSGKNVVAYPCGRLHRPFHLLDGADYVTAAPVSTGGVTASAALGAGERGLGSLWQIAGGNVAHVNSALYLDSEAANVAASAADLAHSLVYSTGAAKLRLGTKTFGFEPEKEITVSANGNVALTLPVAVKIPEGVEAYILKALTYEHGVELLAVAPGSVLPARQPVIFCGLTEPVVLPIAEADAADTEGVLAGTTVELATPGDVFTLRGDNFERLASGSVAANAAYLPAAAVPSELGSSFSLNFSGSQVSISEINAEGTQAPLYDLAGRRAAANPRAGLYITPGAKIIKR